MNRQKWAEQIIGILEDWMCRTVPLECCAPGFPLHVIKTPAKAMNADHAEFISLEFADFDSFVETARSFDWNPIQLSGGALNLRYDAVDVGQFGAFHMKFDPRVYDKSIVGHGSVAFSLVMSECNFDGVPVQQPTLGVMLGSRTYRSTFEPGFQCHEFYCATEVLALHPLGDLLLSARQRNSDLVFPLDMPMAHRIRGIFLGLLDERSVLMAPFARDATCTAVLNQLSRIIAPHLTGRRIPVRNPRKSDLVEEAMHLVQDQSLELTVADLSTTLGVSRRAIEKAFNATVGMSPGQLLLAKRLTSVRDKLARGKGPVGETANSEGFEHLSRFAAQYRRLFDELPSDTLSRSKSNFQSH